jgi:transposase InsO family protein
MEVVVPWRTTDLVNIRDEFVQHALTGRYPITALCNAYGISEKTGHKWLNRFREEGRPGLSDRSHTPHEAPHKISDAVRRDIISLREKHPTWGSRKLRVILKRRSPNISWPAASTIGELLRREGCVKPSKRSKHSVGLPIDSGLTVATAANDVWTTDFKGEFRLLTGPYCYPLTTQDASSRYSIGITALSSTATVPAQIVFTRHFEEFGLPLVMRSDNGVPFASPHAIGRLSKLSVWWIKLGIRPERIEPAHPEQNGQHERMHKTLKGEATRPPSSTLTEQQLRFDRFRREYNDERPHESLSQQTPASRYTASTRVFPTSLPVFEYPRHFEVRPVGSNGMIYFRSRRFFLSESLANEEIGLEETDDDLWTVSLGPLTLGTFHRPSNSFIDEVRWKDEQTPPKEDNKTPPMTPTIEQGSPILPV